MNDLNLDRLFNPRTVAMIGASTSLEKWGHIILTNILKANYKGTVYPVNPKAESVLGYDCYASVKEIPDEIDMAMITTPSGLVLPLIDECGEKNIPFVVVVTSQFSEVGAEGLRLEKEIVAKAQKYGIRLVGPNTMGLFGSGNSLHALMPMVMPLYGNISMFSQSGNVGVQMLDYGIKEAIGFEKFVSSGNEADLNCVDYLRYFGQDNDTKVIMGYIEGVGEDTDFLSVAREISKKKPILLMKGGRTKVGTKTAASHSGSMAGTREINKAVFRQAGIVEALTSLELIDCAKAFANYPIPRGNRVGIVTRGGGWGVLAADSCEEDGLVVPPLPEDLIKQIDKILPEYWNHDNPIDLVASIAYDPMPECMTLLAEWDGVDAVLALGAGFKSYTYEYSPEVKGPKELMKVLHLMSDFFKKNSESPDENLKLMGDLVKRTGKPIISVSIGSNYSHKQFLEEYGIVSYPTPERAVRVLKHMSEYSRFLALNR